MIPTAVITNRGEDRLRRGHPWIYRTDVVDVAADPGAGVESLGPRRRFLGRALYSASSQISLRLLTHGEEEIDEAFWRGRIEAALQFRRSLSIDATAYRVIHAEADLLPSLVVDRYADILVVQALSQGMDRLLPTLVPWLVEATGVCGVLARNDPRVRLLEGLEQRVDVLFGAVPETVVVREGPVRYEVDPRVGQKTGFFLDQRENREAASQYARGRLLDCFSYTGGFALRLAGRCDHVEAI
ncbi:MAG: class I SAM-dependent methyltransferase, partial [Vicinamibacterales bacterium]